jgi:hypothetical protein
VRARRPSREEEVELDRCIDQLLATGSWESRTPPGRARSELDSLMLVAEALRALNPQVTPSRPNLKDRLWASIWKSIHP